MLQSVPPRRALYLGAFVDDVRRRPARGSEGELVGRLERGQEGVEVEPEVAEAQAAKLAPEMLVEVR